MRTRVAFVALGLVLVPLVARAAGPTVLFTLPAQDTTPAVFGSLPFPNDLYFDQGKPGDGDGTLLNAGLPANAKMGLAAATITGNGGLNAGIVEDAFDLMDGFGTTSAVYFFFDGPIDTASLPTSPVLTPALSDSVFCADVATLTPVPVRIKSDVDSRIHNVLGVLPLPGRPLKPRTRYTCVVRGSVTGGGNPVQASADWTSVRDNIGPSANTDADAIFDSVVTALGLASVPASDIAGMTVFTTESTTEDLINIRDVVLPGQSVPTADFTSRPELVFITRLALDALLGPTPHSHIAKVATGYFPSPQFQTPDGSGFPPPINDLPSPPGFITCIAPFLCETNDERFVRDGNGRPIVQSTQQIPVTVVVPLGRAPTGGWPVVIQQHGLGGQRDTVVQFGDEDAGKGFVSIGIDAQAHGYRFFNCGPGASCSQDTGNNFGGTTIPDGFADGSYLTFSVGFITTQLGFFQAFHNLIGIRDNFRQTYADLISVMRLLRGHSIDSALGVPINDGQIFYIGHSLGGLMGSGFVPIEAGIRGALLNAAGGGLLSQLFQNSSIGAGAQVLVNGILGLDSANVADQFSLEANLVQAIVDPADAVNSAGLLLAPVDGAPRNVILVEDYGDQVVPNPANEALALAAGLSLFDPFVQNLHQSALSLPLTPYGSIHGNAAGGLATAALLQNGPATHAASVGTVPGTLTFVPDFGHYDEFPVTGAAFPSLVHGVRVPNAGILGTVLDWFRDIITNGSPGTFAYSTPPNFNPVENHDVPAGASTQTFFARTVSQGGSAPFSEPTPDVTVAFAANVVSTRLTVGRSILGASTAFAGDGDAPPGLGNGVNTLGVLPLFVSLQREIPGLFSADVTIAYTAGEVRAAGIEPGSADEAALLALISAGSCTIGGALCSVNSDCGANGPCVGGGYTVLPSSVNIGGHTITASGVSSPGTLAIVHPDALAAGFRPAAIPGGGSTTTDCRAEWRVFDPTNTPFIGYDGHVNREQYCHDGDASCDADEQANGTCVFRVALCFNEGDLAPACPASGVPVSSYALAAPARTSRNKTDSADAQNLLNVLLAFGGTQGGPRQNTITFTSPIAGTSVCTPLRGVHVPLGLRRGLPVEGRRVVAGVAYVTTGRPDSDRIRLHCLP